MPTGVKEREAELSSLVETPRSISLHREPERGLWLAQLGGSPGKTPNSLTLQRYSYASLSLVPWDPARGFFFVPGFSPTVSVRPSTPSAV